MSIGEVPNSEGKSHCLLYLIYSGLGFKWSWESVFRVSEVSRINVCDEILRMGDRILKVRT
jgi:hypothetical protein